MTAAIHHFPTPADFRARMAAQDEAVALARTIIRGKERPKDDDLRLACDTLMTYGDSLDWTEAYHVLRALDMPKRQTPPPYSRNVGLVRRLIVATPLAVAVPYLALVGVLAQ